MPELYAIQSASPAEDTAPLTALPILILNVHSRCNCRCVMCDIWKRQESAEMRTETLQRHRESIRRLGVQHVVLTGGEPLLHSDLETFCRFFREEGIRLTLLTAGLLLLKRAQQVADLFDEIIVSLDGPEPIHDEIRGIRGSYGLLKQGVAAVRSHRPAMRILCRTTVQRHNHLHLQATVAAAHALHADGISFLAADVTSLAFNRTTELLPERKQEIALNAHELADLRAELETLIAGHAQDIASGFIAESPQKLRRIAERFHERLQQLPGRAPRCNAPWVSAVVEVDGGVRPCFFHPPVGNIGTATLEQALNTPAARSFRQHLDVQSDPVCRRCVCSLHYRPT